MTSRNLYSEAIIELADTLSEWFDDYLREDFALAIGLRAQTQEEMRKLFETVIQQEGGIEAFAQAGLAGGYTEDQIMGFLNRQAQLKEIRDHA